MGEGSGDDPEHEERARHWRELLERRRERDRRLEEMEAEGKIPSPSGDDPQAADAEERQGILERMRDESRVARNPVFDKEEEEAERIAKAKSRAQRVAALVALLGGARRCGLGAARRFRRLQDHGPLRERRPAGPG